MQKVLLKPAIAIAAVAWSSSSAAGAELQAECPGIIPASAIKPDRPIAGWITVVPGQLHLKAAGMMAGAPGTKSYLVPTRTTKEIQTFEFDAGDGQRWLWCSYGTVELVRRLDDKAMNCAVTIKRKKRDGVDTLTATAECR